MMIKDIQTKQLKIFNDDRGCFIEVLKADDPFFEEVKQTSYTETYPGVIKAFHWHKKQDDVWFVARGMAQVVLYDLRKDSPTYKETNVFYMGQKNPMLLFIPHGVAHGYRVLGSKPVALFYHTTEVYDPKNPDEERIPFDDPGIDFDWQTKFK